MSFRDQIDKFIVSQHIKIPYLRPRDTGWPSEASFVSADGVLGKCIRQAWYERKGFEPTNPTDSKAESIFGLGNMIEDWYIEQAKRLGIWVADGIKFYDEVNNISADIDLLIFDTPDNDIAGVECKSAYGHYADKELKEGPKVNNLMQTCLYLDYLNRVFKDKPEVKWSRKFYLEYFMRDSCLKYEHLVELYTKDGLTYPRVNGMETTLFNLEGIHDRYDRLYVLSQFDTPPERDFVYEYSKEEIERRYKEGKLSKTKYNSWVKGTKTVSDWQCLYCPQLDRCWEEKRRSNKQISAQEILERANVKA